MFVHSRSKDSEPIRDSCVWTVGSCQSIRRIVWNIRYVNIFSCISLNGKLNDTQRTTITLQTRASIWIYILRLGMCAVVFTKSNWQNTQLHDRIWVCHVSLCQQKILTTTRVYSMPSIYSWKEAITSPADLTFDSVPVVSRQHQPAPGNLSWPNPNAPVGQKFMLDGVATWVSAANNTNSTDIFAQQCYSTQIYQAMFMAYEISWYRLGAGKPEQSRGAVVWQLNDVWQAPSWSSIEYSGRWKVRVYKVNKRSQPAHSQ